ncbi:hypothetical protein IEO21_00136 [Rhodonia placenta]|uniref:Alpha/beta hydrolase fold-3 domain-containing protein n=1 Tax=Rhodonia placenta TaxID=104341 RepID=A0A8H7PC54_9APHY|nr:hypothetical protein IEO21_00136 [Postia placenta]
MAETESQIHQPIHPDIADKLDPEYAAFHNANNLHVVPLHLKPWDPAVRNGPPVAGGAEPLKVGDVKDLSLSKCSMRVFTPEGSAPEPGWPVLLYFHGGGWTLGNINTEGSFCTNMCKHASSVVISVDYRLAPENPYPAAVEDAVEALHWVYQNGKAQLNVDVSKIAVGGSGGNLAAILAHKAALAEPPIPLTLQLLVVPVTDNTATTSGVPYKSWAENQNTVALSPGRMLWFRDCYLPNEQDRLAWESSPIFAPEELFKKAPKAWIGVCELDVLRDEGIAYGEKLQKAGVDVEIKVYKGAPHPVMAMDGASTCDLNNHYRVH